MTTTLQQKIPRHTRGWPLPAESSHSHFGHTVIDGAVTVDRDFYYTEYSIYCGFINTVGLCIRLSYFHPFQQFFIHFDKFYPFFIHYSSNLPILNNVEKIVWPTIYAVLGVVIARASFWTPRPIP
jgi:hypothetical protein